ncbi:YrhK family protein [Citreimonas sp.]|uniref:YrhK family protein n=1 Tax=Citreimonas sp. TaxID=3036715 RepID=UPI0035C7DF7E
MANPLKTLVQEYSWVHLGLGLCGNVLFFLGSVAFLPRLAKVVPPWLDHPVEWQTAGVWMFILGAFLMLVGSLGQLLVSIFEAREKQ